MLGNGIKQTTSTTGTGSLTLAAATGYPKVSDVVPVGFPVAYSLLDSSGLLLETGIGHLSDSTTFVRAKVTATYSSGVYSGGPASTSSPSAVSLTGTTTLIVAADAAIVESMLPTVDSNSASVNRLLHSAARTGTTTNFTLGALRVYYVPFLLRCAAPVAALSIHVITAAAAGSVARLGIYACTEGGYIGNLLATTGDIDVTTTGYKQTSLSSPLSLPPGWYYTAIVSSGAPNIYAHTSSGANMVGGCPLGYDSTANVAPIDYRFETLASAVLLSTASATTSKNTAGGSNIPLVLMVTA